jgi:diguanylate cyclase (GGDEF)-like protein
VNAYPAATAFGPPADPDANTAERRVDSLFPVLARTRLALRDARDPAALFQDVCRIVVECHLGCSAWLGLVSEGALVPAACWCASPKGLGLRDVQVRIEATSPLGQGPAARAHRSGRTCVTNDFFADTATTPWHAAARRAGIECSASFPFVTGNGQSGVFSVYGPHRGAFTPPIVTLIEHVVADMCHAIHDLEHGQGQRKALAEAQAGFDRFRAIFHRTPTPSAVASLADGRLMEVNDAYCALFGCSRERPGTCTFDADGGFAPLRELLLGQGRLRDAEFRVRPHAGEPRDVLVHAEPLDFPGEPRVLITLTDITDRRRHEARVEYLATHDELTGLPNRALVRDRLQQALERGRRSATYVAVMFVDLDRFKVVNDEHGHLAGDELLKEAARRLTMLVRGTDTVARIGGDEFLVVLSDLHKSADAYVVAQKIIDAFEVPFMVTAAKAYVGASVGVALAPQDGQDVDSVIRNADVAMYRAKGLGGDSYQFFNSDMSRIALRRLEVETQLRTAMVRQELRLRYQPKVDMRSMRITGCEALIAWESPVLGAVPPTEFIPVAEESGLIMAIGDWVLETACAQGRRWQQTLPEPLAVAVNLSSRQFMRHDVAGWITDTLRRTGFDPALLELELTESLIAHDPDKVAETIRELRACGVRFSIDDFGTGYSSLAYLKRFQVNALKIDRSFVRNLSAGAEDEAIALAVISLASSLRLKVIGEGVETQEQWDFLRAHGCDEAQGYLVGKPVPPECLARILRDGNRLPATFPLQESAA